jgi:hypothetical protein
LWALPDPIELSTLYSGDLETLLSYVRALNEVDKETESARDFYLDRIALLANDDLIGWLINEADEWAYRPATTDEIEKYVK